MLSSKKAVFFVLLVIIVISSLNTFNNIYKQILQTDITGHATGIAAFELLEGPGHYNVSINLFWLPHNVAPGFKSGQPVGINVSVQYLDGTPVDNATVYLLEQNGWSIFAPIQPYDGAVTNYQYGIAKTNSLGLVNFSTTTTGGQGGLESLIGPYNITVSVYKGDLLLNETSYISLDRTLPSPDGSTYVSPNQNWVNEVRDKLATVSNLVGAWSGGDNKAITIYTDGTDNGTVLNGTSGKPIGLYLTVLNHTDLQPIENVTVRVSEDNGWGAVGLSQFWSSEGVSTMQTAETLTDSSGYSNFTIIPTGGQAGFESIVGDYQVYLKLYLDGQEFYSKQITITDRTLSQGDGTGSPVPNQDWVNEARDKIFTVADKMGGWT